ncbi:MAG: divergent polysaccharide deacetylase family protein [Desulfobacterales bacterium]|nr:divergent polysaccharide deacetylase family protein [Desulfobacterales bacterium]
MNRRRFLKSAVWITGLVGVMGLSRRAAAMTMAAPRPKIALIVDDIGFSQQRTELFLALGAPVTFSILPHRPLSEVLAHQIHGAGHEIMLHQPMEPVSDQFDPGPGALWVHSDPFQIHRILQDNIDSIPHAVGVNNHMGSRFTACCDKITQALGVVQDNGLFFVDSRTSGQSIAFETARSLQMPSARRHVFLDNVRQVRAVTTQLRRLERRALAFGSAVAIGHPFPETAAAISLWLKQVAGRVDLVYVSRLLRRS